MKPKNEWRPNLTPTQRAVFENETPLIFCAGGRNMGKSEVMRRMRLTRFKTGPELRNWKPGQPYLTHETMPLRAPNRFARFHWRGLLVCLVIVAIGAALSIASR